MANDSETISFRVPKHVAKQLKDRGAALNLSRNEYARYLVQGALEAPTTTDLLSEFNEMKASLAARPLLGSEAVRDLAASIAKELGNGASAAQMSRPGSQAAQQASQDLTSTVTRQYQNLEEAFGQIIQFLRTAEQRREARPATTSQVDELHESLATSVVALLIRLGNVDPKEAEEWARANILRSSNNGR